MKKSNIVQSNEIKKFIGLILTAGASSRLGMPKALIDVNGVPMIRAHIHSLQHVCGRIIVLTGHKPQSIRPWIYDCEEVHNPDWQTDEMRDSILKGLAVLQDNDQVILSPVDTPPAPISSLKELIKTQPPAACAYKEQYGHPLLAEAGWYRKRLKEAPLNNWLSEISKVDASEDCLLNLNNSVEWKKWLGQLPKTVQE